MTFTDLRELTIIARAKIRRITEPCDDSCPGWFVAETIRDNEVQRCDACFAGIKDEDKLTDEEAGALPEARALLAEVLRDDGEPVEKRGEA